MPAVSVVIPTYNHRQFIGDAIKSVFAQTFTDYELIVIDDGSTDGTSEILKPLADENKLRLIRQTNAGQAAARNRGIAESTGEFIAFLDDDDVWLPDKLDWQTKAIRANDWIAVGGSCNVFGEDRDSPPAFGPSREVLLMDLFEGNPFHSPGQVMVQRKALLAIGSFNTDIWGVDDLDLYMRLAKSGKLGAVDQPALRYRLHNTNASNQIARMFQNGAKVIRNNIGLVPLEQRSLARRNAYRWLYQYSGGRVVRDALNSFDFQKWSAAAQVWLTLALPALLDPALLRALIWEITPHLIRQKLDSASVCPTS